MTRGRTIHVEPSPPPTECAEGCGCCCDPVVLPYGPLDLLTRPFDAETKAWVRDHLTPISRREGLRLAPYLDGGVTTGLVDGQVGFAWSWFYRCDLFDTESRLCTDYEHRPALCRDYPTYGDGPNPAKALPTCCTFRADVGREVESVAVVLGRRER